MAEISKPSDINKIWAASGDKLAPSDSKISTGWQVEIPPRQYFNYIDNKQDQAIAHINQHGIAVWDNTTEYQWSSTGTKSLCMGSDGTIYRTKQVSINQNPVTDTTDTYWEIAFANVADFYTQTQSDARYLQKSANLSDLLNPATARTNLSVYSQAQTYTKTETDAKTTVASTVQAQQFTSNNVLLTPLRLAEAFSGTNNSVTANGYTTLPNGVIMQWGSVTVASGGSVTFPKAFPNTVFTIQVEHGFGALAAVATGVAASSTTGFTILHSGSGTLGFKYFAVGN